jgi:phage-related minor tail protein
LGGFFKNLFRAEGGPVGAGNPYIVGERGPELFVPRNSGSIISNDRLSGASMGGGGVNITYNIAAGVSRAELAPILEMERRRLKAEIPDMVRRGGAYRTAFA